MRDTDLRRSLSRASRAGSPASPVTLGASSSSSSSDCPVKERSSVSIRGWWDSRKARPSSVTEIRP